MELALTITVMRIAVGIGGPASGARRDWPETVRFAVESVRLGIDFCWSAETWGQECVAPLAYLAARTDRMRLGTGIMQISALELAFAARPLEYSGSHFVLPRPGGEGKILRLAQRVPG